MKGLFLIVLVLLLVFSMGALFAQELNVGGKSAATAMANDRKEAEINFDQEFDIDFGPLHVDVNGGYDYFPHAADADAISKWDWLFGAYYTYSVFKAGGKFTGDKEVNLEEFVGELDIELTPVHFDVDLTLSIDSVDGIDTFQGLDISALATFGPANFRLGYLLTDEKNGDTNAPEDSFQFGGVYAKAEVVY